MILGVGTISFKELRAQGLYITLHPVSGLNHKLEVLSWCLPLCHTSLYHWDSDPPNNCQQIFFVTKYFFLFNEASALCSAVLSMILTCVVRFKWEQ